MIPCEYCQALVLPHMYTQHVLRCQMMNMFVEDDENIVERYVRSAHQVNGVNIRDFLEMHHSPPTAREMQYQRHPKASKGIDRFSCISDLTDKEIGDIQCAICLEDLNSTMIMRRLNTCRHIFCHLCIKSWLNISKTCPICKHAIGEDVTKN
jgi:hypothetical protein